MKKTIDNKLLLRHRWLVKHIEAGHEEGPEATSVETNVDLSTVEGIEHYIAVKDEIKKLEKKLL